MNVRIAVEDPLANSLYRWLAADPEVRGAATLSLGVEHEPGDMGTTLEVVNVVLSNAIAFSSLVVAIASWRSSRPKPPRVKVERDGVAVPLDPEQK